MQSKDGEVSPAQGCDRRVLSRASAGPRLGGEADRGGLLSPPGLHPPWSAGCNEPQTRTWVGVCEGQGCTKTC